LSSASAGLAASEILRVFAALISVLAAFLWLGREFCKAPFPTCGSSYQRQHGRPARKCATPLLLSSENAEALA
jgi:hypothetical protein